MDGDTSVPSFVGIVQKGNETVLMEAERRRGDEKGPRTVPWDEDTRRLVASVMAEIYADSERRTAEHVNRVFGIDPETHAEHHAGLGELIPWITAQKIKAEKQAEFWGSLTRSIVSDGVKGIVKWGSLVLVLAVAFGLAKAVGILAPLFSP